MLPTLRIQPLHSFLLSLLRFFFWVRRVLGLRVIYISLAIYHDVWCFQPPKVTKLWSVLLPPLPGQVPGATETAIAEAKPPLNPRRTEETLIKSLLHVLGVTVPFLLGHPGAYLLRNRTFQVAIYLLLRYCFL